MKIFSVATEEFTTAQTRLSGLVQVLLLFQQAGHFTAVLLKVGSVARKTTILLSDALGRSPNLHIEDDHDDGRAIERDNGGVDLIGKMINHLKTQNGFNFVRLYIFSDTQI